MNSKRVIVSTTHPTAGCAVCEGLVRNVQAGITGDASGVVRLTSPGSVVHEVKFVEGPES